ncbi:hypothetical protein P3342_010922 [Pyrenophora teres f. teres]|nr:hypothetical protein P3342_010922 [Pyrenophora teres f. teres]
MMSVFALEEWTSTVSGSMPPVLCSTEFHGAQAIPFGATTTTSAFLPSSKLPISASGPSALAPLMVANSKVS